MNFTKIPIHIGNSYYLTLLFQNSTNEFRLPINHQNLYFYARQIWNYFRNINILRLHCFVIYWLWFALIVVKPRWIFCQCCNLGKLFENLKYCHAKLFILVSFLFRRISFIPTGIIAQSYLYSSNVGLF